MVVLTDDVVRVLVLSEPARARWATRRGVALKGRGQRPTLATPRMEQHEPICDERDGALSGGSEDGRKKSEWVLEKRYLINLS